MSAKVRILFYLQSLISRIDKIVTLIVIQHLASAVSRLTVNLIYIKIE